MTFKDDYTELLTHVLSQLLAEHWKLYYYSHDSRAPDVLEIEAEEFEMRVSKLNSLTILGS
jgi:hypothetical protein